MNQYIFFALGIILGIAIELYYFSCREERIEERIRYDQKMYSTETLNITMKIIVDKINENIRKLNRELTEEEKNEIIKECYKEKFYI